MSVLNIFMQQFYESEGLILNNPELLPKDPFIDKRFNALQKRTFHTPDVCSIAMLYILAD